MKPNILLITADQWRGDCLSALSHPAVKTPNVDALAAEGVLFARHYAGTAPCSPARASLYTGLYQMNHRVCRNGSPLDARFDNVALMARRAGYDPTLFGYTDTAPDPRALAPGDPHLTSYEGVLPGFTTRQLLPEHEKQWLSWLRERGHTGATDRRVHFPAGTSPEGGWPEVNRAEPHYGADETQTAFLTGEFIRWVGEQEAPWFAHVSFLRPHPPFVVPAPYNDMYAPPGPEVFARAQSIEAEKAAHPYIAYDLDRQTKSSFMIGIRGRVGNWSAEEMAVLRAIYYGMISEVDAQLGRIWQALKDGQAWDNTIIVFTSDHAEMAGDHWSFGKSGFFEGSYHIPLVIRDPVNRGGAGRRVDRFTSAVDVLPTLCEHLAEPAGNHLDGQSLIPFLNGREPGEWRDAAFWEFDFRDIPGERSEAHFGLPPNACNLSVLRDEAFKYVHFAGMRPMLFDLAADPQELRNVAEDPAYLPVRLAYAERLLSLRARHLDQTLAYTELTEKGPVTRR